jgi:hypothetical protein
MEEDGLECHPSVIRLIRGNGQIILERIVLYLVWIIDWLQNIHILMHWKMFGSSIYGLYEI